MTDKKQLGKAELFYRYHEILAHAKETYQMDKRLAKEFGIKAVKERNNPFDYNTHRRQFKWWQNAYLKEMFDK